MTVFFNDTATEAVTTLLTAHTSDSGHGWVGWAGELSPAPSVYTSYGGVIASGATTNLPCVWRVSVIAPAADVTVSQDWYIDNAALPIVFGAAARLNAAGNAGYAAVYSKTAGAWVIVRIGAALATTTLATSAPVSYANGSTATIEFIVSGSGATVNLELKVGGATLLTTTDTSGSRITAAGYVGFWMTTEVAASGMFLASMSASDLAAADTTPPTLTTPTATVTGPTTAAGSVTTTEAGPAWAVLTTTATTPTAAQIKAGQNSAGVVSPAATATLVSGANSTAFSFTGLTPSTGYYLHITQDDTATPANTATPVTAAMVTTNTPVVITMPALKNNTGTLLANEVGATVHVYAVATGNKVVTKTAQTSDASGVMAVTDAALVAATEYRCVIVLASGAEGLQKATAA